MSADPAAEGTLDALGARLRAALAGRYAVERSIGAGAMGSVWLARDEGLDRPVAIKVIAPELTTSAVFRERFLQEARTVARLRHPHIVGVYAAGEAAGLLWFAMEYVRGASLRERLERDGPAPPDAAARLLRDLADALATAHAAGVVHRDVKPENVLVEADTGRALLTDFGVARALQPAGAGDDRLTRAGVAVGSPRYMSPEQAAGDRDVDARSDIYALGLVGYELLAGAPPFAGGTPAALLVRQLTEPPPPLALRAPGAPPALAAVVERALRKDPAERWADAAAMRDALDAVLRGEATPASATEVASGAPTLVPIAPAAPTRRRRRRVLVGAALALAALGGAALAAAHRARGGAAPHRSIAVAPFDVLSPDPALAWLREGSVSMLTLDLAQWEDVHVVDYEHTLDVLRAAGLDGARALGLDDARRFARRAGAATVITGRVQSTGDSLVVVASLYDVASGRKIDAAQRAAPVRADPRAAFDALARDLLNLVAVSGAPEGTAQLTRTTTASLGAYRDYLDGVRALNGWQLARADSLFGRAVAQDSTFALAWYKRALGRGWANQGDSTQLGYMARAIANADRLGPREQGVVRAYDALVRGLVAGSRQGPAAMAALFDTARARYEGVVARDSTAAEAWFGLGQAWVLLAFAEQLQMQQRLAALSGQPAAARPILRSAGVRSTHAFSGARRALERTIALDSTFHLAYPMLLRVYESIASPTATVVLDGDTLVAVSDSAARRAVGPARIAASRDRARVALLAAARGWAAADPDVETAQASLLDAYVGAGLPDSAVAAARRALARPNLRAPQVAYGAVGAQLLADPAGVPAALRAALTRYPADSLRPALDGNASYAIGNAGEAAAAVGRFDDMRATFAAAARARPAYTALGAAGALPADALLRWYGAALETAAGVPASPATRRLLLAGARTFEANVTAAAGAAASGTAITSAIPIPYVAYLATGDSAFLDVTARWAARGGAPPLPELDALAALARGDTARAMGLARQFPPPDTTAPLMYSGLRTAARAEFFARAGDPRRALALYEMLDPRRFMSFGGFETGWAVYARTLLARAALYEQTGDRARAAASYAQALAYWQAADPAMAPQVTAVRAGLARTRDAAGGPPVTITR
ncbi:hypothetical protein tb265_20770 [Gemmatimonadetes bacterium T265]|nr:hypothetical protein tb265_20770 [Gemmatimonadetes bacterium T265]